MCLYSLTIPQVSRWTIVCSGLVEIAQEDVVREVGDQPFKCVCSAHLGTRDRVISVLRCVSGHHQSATRGGDAGKCTRCGYKAFSQQ